MINCKLNEMSTNNSTIATIQAPTPKNANMNPGKIISNNNTINPNMNQTTGGLSSQNIVSLLWIDS